MSNTINNANEVQVINNNGELVVSSRKVAEDFGKEHNKVIRTIEEIRGVAKIGDTKEMFYKTTYIHPQNGQEYPEYLMNRDGFSMVVMGFTGAKAIEWKLKYIKAFNAMEKKLKELSAPQTLDDTLNADVLFLIASKWKADSDKRKELEVRVAELEAQIKTQQVQPVISEATKVAIKEAKVEQHRLYTVSEIARECGFPDARTLNLALNDLGIQYKIKSHWQLAEKYKELGYAIIVSPYANTPFLKWTLKGKEFIREQLKKAHLL
jgi:Rha family phage regulatory protein